MTTFWPDMAALAVTIRSLLEINDCTDNKSICISPRKLPLVDGIFTQEHDDATPEEWNEFLPHLYNLFALCGDTRAILINPYRFPILPESLWLVDGKVLPEYADQIKTLGRCVYAVIDFTRHRDELNQIWDQANCRGGSADVNFFFPHNQLIMTLLGGHSNIIFRAEETTELVQKISDYCQRNDITSGIY